MSDGVCPIFLPASVTYFGRRTGVERILPKTWTCVKMCGVAFGCAIVGNKALPNSPVVLPTLVWKAALVGLLVAVAFVAYIWVSSGIAIDISIGDQWMEAVSRYGIEPVYPPQEDVYVGDVLAIVTEDATRDKNLGPLPARSIVLQHVDLSEALNLRYKDTFRVPDSMEWPGEGKIWKSEQMQGSIFAEKGPLNHLPLALLPDFAITASKSSKLTAGSLSDLAAKFGFTAEKDRTITFKIGGIETYGITALDGQDALDKFCDDRNTQLECQEKIARRRLSTIFGKSIFENVRDPRTWEVKPRFSVELCLITRVYLIRRLETKIEDRSGARADFESANSEGSAVAPKEQKPLNVPLPLTGYFETKNGTLIGGTAQTFERPIAFGFRSVRHRLKVEERPK